MWTIFFATSQCVFFFFWHINSKHTQELKHCAIQPITCTPSSLWCTAGKQKNTHTFVELSEGDMLTTPVSGWEERLLHYDHITHCSGLACMCVSVCKCACMRSAPAQWWCFIITKSWVLCHRIEKAIFKVVVSIYRLTYVWKLFLGFPTVFFFSPQVTHHSWDKDHFR